MADPPVTPQNQQVTRALPINSSSSFRAKFPAGNDAASSASLNRHEACSMATSAATSRSRASAGLRTST
jgi:hypothetical protein